MIRQNSVALLLFFALLGCVEDDSKRFTATCVDGTVEEVYDGTGALSYTDTISGIPSSESHFVITQHNIAQATLPLVICNPEDFEIFEPGMASLDVSFQGIVEILPETIDAGSTTLQIESIKPR